MFKDPSHNRELNQGTSGMLFTKMIVDYEAN
jgi:hypothetical protein